MQSDQKPHTSSPADFKFVPISSLLLDPENPRLPDSYRGAPQAELAVVLEMGFESFAVAQSIAANGFFLAEPLLVISDPASTDRWIVVEGNRRLTALIGLTNDDIRLQFVDSDKWSALATKSSLTGDTTVPVVVHPNRESTFAQVGKAHVVGKLPWRPYAQAAYIAARVDEGRSYADVADLIGMTKGKVADLYRDRAILSQAQEAGLETSQVESAFSLLTVAMSSVKLREHVGAPLGSQLKPGDSPVPSDKIPQLAELITWVFGDDDNEPLITDSRQISQLGHVVGTEVGLASLRGGDSLDQARQKVQSSGLPPRERLVNRLNSAKNSLDAANADLGDFTDDEGIRSLFDDIDSSVESLRSILNGSLSSE